LFSSKGAPAPSNPWVGAPPCTRSVAVLRTLGVAEPLMRVPFLWTHKEKEPKEIPSGQGLFGPPSTPATGRHGPRRLPPIFFPEAGPTPASATLSPQVSRVLRATVPQLPTGRIRQVPLRARASADTRPCSRGGLFAATAPRYRQKIRLITP